MKKLLVLILLLFASQAFSATYYIDYNAADDSANGTSTATPWKRAPGMTGFAGSYTHAAGDVFVFKGGVTWPSASLPLSIVGSGLSATPDIYMGGQRCGESGSVACNSGSAWGSGYAIFDGEDAGSFNTGVIYSAIKSYITVDGIKIIRAGNTTDGSGAGIFLAGGGGLTIKNNWLETNAVNGLAYSTTSGTYSAIHIYNNTIKKSGRIHFTAGNARITDFRFYNNTFYGAYDYDPKSFHTDGLMIGGDGDTDYAIQGLYIYGNKFTGDWTRSATAMIYLNGTPMSCYSFTNGAHEPTVDSVLYDSVNGDVQAGQGKVYYVTLASGSWDGTGTGTLCVSASNWTNGATVTEMATYGGQTVAVLSSTATGSALKSTKTVSIYNNLLVTENNSGTPMSPAAIDVSGGHSGVKVYNNTIDTRSNMTMSHCVYFGNYVVDPTVENNILAGCDNGITFAESSITGTKTIDYNLFYTAGLNHLLWDVGASNRYNTCSTLQAAGFGTSYCAISDPLFTTLPSGGTVGSGNWTLQSGSPAIDSGLDLSASFTTDILGNTRSTWDIGAYEYGASGDTTAPTITTATVGTTGTTLTLAMSEAVTVNNPSGFTLTMSGGACTLAYVSGSGTSSLVYNITNRTVDKDETGTGDNGLAYTTVANGIEDSAGNDLASISGTMDVTNSSTYTPSVTTYTITVQESGHATLSPLSNQVVPTGEDSTTFTCTPWNGWTCSWGGTCGATGSGTTYQKTAIDADCTVTLTATEIKLFN